MKERMEADDQYLAAVRRVRAALERLASALTAARLDDLLETEQDLARSLTALPNAGGRLEGDRTELAHELAGLRRALVRCRRLGQTLGGLLRVSESSRTPGAGYDHAGMVPTRAVMRVLEERA